MKVSTLPSILILILILFTEFEKKSILDRALFIQNLYTETLPSQQTLASLAADPITSRILEKLIVLSTDAQIRQLLHTLDGLYGLFY
jgi:hypothetical protein